jgi:hypothetical protein
MDVAAGVSWRAAFKSAAANARAIGPPEEDAPCLERLAAEMPRRRVRRHLAGNEGF